MAVQEVDTIRVGYAAVGLLPIAAAESVFGDENWPPVAFVSELDPVVVGLRRHGPVERRARIAGWVGDDLWPTVLAGPHEWRVVEIRAKSIELLRDDVEISGSEARHLV